MNIEDIKKLPDNSVTNRKLIVKISQLSIEHHNIEILSKIKNGYEVAGLYPNKIKSLNIIPNK